MLVQLFIKNLDELDNFKKKKSVRKFILIDLKNVNSLNYDEDGICFGTEFGTYIKSERSDVIFFVSAWVRGRVGCTPRWTLSWRTG